MPISSFLRLKMILEICQKVVSLDLKTALTLSTAKLKSVNAFGLSVCPSVHALVLGNILQLSWNWFMFFKLSIEFFVLRMVYVELMVHVQTHIKGNTNALRLMGKIF